MIEPTTLEMFRGDTGKWTVPLTELDGVTALNLTSCSLKMAVYEAPPNPAATNDDDAEFVLSSPSSGIAITDAGGGIVTVTISKTQSAALLRERYFFDMQLTNATGEEYTVAHGSIFLTPQFTH